MTTALGQFMLRRPRESAWFVGGICLLLAGPTLRAQDTQTDQPLSDRDHPVAAPSALRRTFVGVVTGRVTDARTSGPVAGATVEVEGARIVGTTGDDGRYR